MIKEFRDFLFRGNVIDLAVAVVIGAAFVGLVTSLVEDVLTPLLGILGIPAFSAWKVALGGAELRLGSFLNALISFVMIAGAIFFLVAKPRQQVLRRQAQAHAAPGAPAEPTEVELLTQIRDALRERGS